MHFFEVSNVARVWPIAFRRIIGLFSPFSPDCIYLCIFECCLKDLVHRDAMGCAYPVAHLRGNIAFVSTKLVTKLKDLSLKPSLYLWI